MIEAATLPSLGGLLFLSPDTGLLIVLPPPGFSKDSLLLYFLIETSQGVLKSLVFAYDDLRHMFPSLLPSC